MFLKSLWVLKISIFSRVMFLLIGSFREDGGGFQQR